MYLNFTKEKVLQFLFPSLNFNHNTVRLKRTMRLPASVDYDMWCLSEAYMRLFQTSMMELFRQNSLSLTIFPKSSIIWGKVFKNGPSEICGKQPLKNMKWYGLLRLTFLSADFLKAVFHKFYFVHFWILCPIYTSLLTLNFFSSNLVELRILWSFFFSGCLYTALQELNCWWCQQMALQIRI